MKINNDPDGEYTDSEPVAGSSEDVGGDEQAEGEYTDSDAPAENPKAP